MKNILVLLITSLVLVFQGCGSKSDPINTGPDDPGNAEPNAEIIVENYTGMGAQIGGYDDLQQLTGSPTLSEEDWQKVFDRLDFIRPGLVRATGSEGWNYAIGGVYNPQKSANVLFKMLDYCQQNDITVIWGEWGHQGGDNINLDWLEWSLNFLSYLVNDKGYTCVKYFNMVNEPNGDWSTIGGNYLLWRTLINHTYEKMGEKNLLDKVQIMGPDVAISSAGFTGSQMVSHTFISNTVRDLNDKIAAYDYHLYPGDNVVENDKFLISSKAFKRLVPATKDVFITELGFKYEPSTAKGQLNQQLINADPYAASNANMMVYESVYAIDVSAALIQLALAGYGGALLWRLDDAQYRSAEGKFTRWGLWNIIGKEYFDNPQDENVRPWFYTTSLLSRYMPKGSAILDVNPNRVPGVYAVGAAKDGKYSIALVNTGTTKRTAKISIQAGLKLDGVKVYSFKAGTRRDFEGKTDDNGFPVPTSQSSIDFGTSNVYEVEIQASSMMMLTNMD